MIKNPSFEGPWTDVIFPNLKNQQPEHWQLSIVPIGNKLYDSDDVAKGIPECVHKLDWQLPEHERPGGSDPLILDGKAVYKIFHSGASFGVSLTQIITGLTPGAEILIGVQVRCHRHAGGSDPYATEFYQGTLEDGKGSWWNAEKLPHKKWVIREQRRIVDASGKLTLILRVKSKYDQPVDWFLDDFYFDVLSTPEPPPVEPPPDSDLEARVTALEQNVVALSQLVSEHEDRITVLESSTPQPPPTEPPPPTGERVNVLSFMRGVHRTQFDKEYKFTNGVTGTQTTQIWHINATDWLHIKGENKQYWHLGIRPFQGEDWIFFFEDTSEGPDRWFAHFLTKGGAIGAPWIPVNPIINHWYETTKWVQHYETKDQKPNCKELNGGQVTDRLRLISKPYDRLYPSGKILQVVTLEWEQGEQYDWAGGNVAFRDETRDYWFMGWLQGRADKTYNKVTCMNVGW